MACVLPKPQLHVSQRLDIPMLTDDALASSVGVRVAFTERAGGISQGPYRSLNLATHVYDDFETVLANRRLLAHAFGVDEERMIVPNQVHGTDIVTVGDASLDSIAQARSLAEIGADALVVEVPQVAALLCFADCASIIIVSPTGRFSVAHAGWRGAVAGIVGKTIKEMVQLDELSGSHGTAGGMNIYVGPHLHVECFEAGPEVCSQFVAAFGDCCVADGHVSLEQAVRCDAERAGADPARIVVAPYCTKCNSEKYFSYRGSGGTCGRHGAFAVRL